MNKLVNPYLLQHSDFTNHIVVVCPKCANKCLIKSPGLYKENADALTVCTCVHCGYNKTYTDKTPDVKITNSKGSTTAHHVKELGGEVDPFFHHSLWYMASCLEGSIWAYNLEHLEIIETFIAATNRSRNGLPYKNNSIASRLPKWMSAAKNRTTVLKCIHGLKLKKTHE